VGVELIGRRAVVLTGLAGVACSRSAAAWTLPPAGVLAFRMMRMGHEIGRHELTFQTNGPDLTVRIRVDALVTLLSIPVVRYTHRGEESWQNGVLGRVAATTNKNGEREWIDARRDASGLVVTGSQTPRYVAPPGALPTSYWNRRMLQAPMISLEDGVLLRPTVVAHPAQSVRLASGGSIAADGYSLRGTLNVDLWYDHSDAWAGFAFRVADGSSIQYERL
jgi:hypothetical protein